MKINCEDFISALDKGGVQAYNKLTELRMIVKEIQDTWRARNFVEVRIFNEDGDITDILRKEFPKYQIRWEGEEDCCGENIIWVPGDEWNDELKAKLSKFDSDVGHHQEKMQAWKLIEGVSLPFGLQTAIDEIKKNYESRNGKPLEVVQIPAYAFRNWPFNQFEHEKERYFTETYTVVREWDTELKVWNFRKDSHYDDELRNKTIEI